MMSENGVYMIGNEKVLEIDLSSEKIKIKDVPKEIIKKYIGGKGVCTKILFDSLKPKTDALGPDNLLIFGTGSGIADEVIID